MSHPSLGLCSLGYAPNFSLTANSILLHQQNAPLQAAYLFYIIVHHDYGRIYGLIEIAFSGSIISPQGLVFIVLGLQGPWRSIER